MSRQLGRPVQFVVFPAALVLRDLHRRFLRIDDEARGTT